VRVRWTASAEQDRADVWDFIVAEDPVAAARMDELFSDAAARLATFPKVGKEGACAEPVNCLHTVATCLCTRSSTTLRGS